MRSFFTLALLLGSSLAPAIQAQTVPRPASELEIRPVNGKPMLLSSLRGKVVIVEFLITTCPHCQHEAQLLSKLNTEYGPRGFQVVGVALDGNLLPGIAPGVVGNFIRDHRVNFPVGYSEQPPALNFLGISSIERWVVPQVAIIDRKGVIRAQTPAAGAERFQKEDFLRSQIEPLLKETAAKQTTTVKKGAS